MAPNMKSFEPANRERWGMLVKSWSTGRNYFDPSEPAPSIPRTLQELKDQCEMYRCGAKIADWITDIAVLTYGPSVLGIRIPPAAMIERSEAMIRNANTPIEGTEQPDPDLIPGDYPLPDFYLEFMRLRPFERDLDKLMEFHHKRIGEYTVNSCT